MRLRQLFEGTARRIVAVMPGGFHPFHPGHKSLYDWAVQTFGKDNVYVAATDDTAVRPFPFEVKKQLAAMAGVPKDRFIQVKSPFNAMSYNNLLEPDTAIVFVRSVKDKTEQPLPDQTKKNGEPGYLKTYTGKNLDTANQSGYMAYGPTINFDFSGMKFKSAGELRNTWPAMSPEDKLKAAKLLYGNGAPVAVELLDKALGGAVEEGTADDIIGKAGTLAGAAGAAVISSAGAASRLAWQGLKYVIAGILNIHPEDVAFVRQQLSKQGKAALYNLAKDGGRVEPTLQKTLELTPRMRMDAIKKLIGDIEAKAAAKAAAATVSRTTGAGRGAGGRIFSINDNPIQSGQNALGQKWLEMSNESNPFTDVSKAAKIDLKTAIKTLNPREQEVIQMRFQHDMTFDAIGKELGVGKDRVAQILAKIIRKLKHPSRGVVEPTTENFADGRKKVQEALDTPYPYQWHKQDEDHYVAKADTPAGLMLIMFEWMQGDESWNIDFAVNGRMGKSGAGDEFSIFATVIAVIRDWVSKVDLSTVKLISFSADKSGDAGTSRTKLYTRFAKQMASQLGWRLEVNTRDTVDDFFKMHNPDVQVKEAVAGQGMEPEDAQDAAAEFFKVDPAEFDKFFSSRNESSELDRIKKLSGI
jgi:RNA polymerase sigma factor FliA